MADERVVTELAIEGAQASVQQILSVQTAITNLTNQLLATSRIRTPQLATDIENIAQQINALGNTGATNVEQLAKAFVDLANKLEAARVRTTQLKDTISNVQGAASNVQAFSTPNNLGNPQRLQVAIDAAQFTAARNAMAAQAAAAQTLQGRLASLGATIRDFVAQNLQIGQSSRQAAVALDQEGEATTHTGARGITYLSVLSAIHASSALIC